MVRWCLSPDEQQWVTSGRPAQRLVRFLDGGYDGAFVDPAGLR